MTTPKEPPGHGEDDCAFRSFLDRVADKWSMLIVVTLEQTPKQRMRFSALMRAVPGISQRMLTTTLRHLERDGLLTRHFYPEIPPRVEYELTALGKDLKSPMGQLVRWIRFNWKAIKKARGSFDRKKPGRDGRV